MAAFTNEKFVSRWQSDHDSTTTSDNKISEGMKNLFDYREGLVSTGRGTPKPTRHDPSDS